MGSCQDEHGQDCLTEVRLKVVKVRRSSSALAAKSEHHAYFNPVPMIVGLAK